MPAKVLISGDKLDISVLDGMALMSKEDVIAIVKSLTVTEQHWVYMQLVRHLDGVCNGE